ncbi:MAG: hypothetical protein ACREJD_03700 [Phycisphaerales bacterium]
MKRHSIVVRTTFSVALLWSSGAAHAQPFNHILGRPNALSFADGVTILTNGDIGLIGGIYQNPATDARASITRTDSSGTPIWNLTLDSQNAFDFGFRLRPTPSGDLVAAMYTSSGDTSLCLARISGAGAVLWTRRYDGSPLLSGVGMEIDTSLTPFRILVAGSLASGSSTSAHLLRATGNSGALDFNHIYEPPGNLANSMYFTDVAFTSATDYFVTGGIQFKNDSSRGNDILVARISRSTGDVVWCKAIGLTFINNSGEAGMAIELTASGKVAVAAQTGDPTGQSSPAGAVHFLLDPDTGDVLSTSAVRDVQVAIASLNRLSTGQLVVSGTRLLAGGQTRAQMWLLNGADLSVLWRAEYTRSQSSGHDAVEQLVPTQALLLAGSNDNSPFNIGTSDTMLIRTDLTGNDNCSALISVPEPIVPEFFASSVTLKRSEATQSLAFAPTATLSNFITQSACRPDCSGDLNSDGFVDDSDFVIFAAAYNILDCADPSMPPGCPADLNDDNFVDDADFVIFAAAYNELVCP